MYDDVGRSAPLLRPCTQTKQYDALLSDRVGCPFADLGYTCEADHSRVADDRLTTEHSVGIDYHFYMGHGLYFPGERPLQFLRQLAYHVMTHPIHNCSDCMGQAVFDSAMQAARADQTMTLVEESHSVWFRLDSWQLSRAIVCLPSNASLLYEVFMQAMDINQELKANSVFGR